MDQSCSGEKEPFFDLESGINNVAGNSVVFVDEKVVRQHGAGKKLWSEFGMNDGSMSDSLRSSIMSSHVNGEAILERRFSGGEESVDVLEKKQGSDKPKKTSCKKPPKPPRPPKSPSLDVTDQKLVREITEIALLKRARIERMRALKKMKNAKSHSNCSSLCALVITIIFCLVILWQGFFNKGASSVSFHGSPESSVRTDGDFVSVKFYGYLSTTAPYGSTSASPDIVEPTSGQGGYVSGSSLVG